MFTKITRLFLIFVFLLSACTGVSLTPPPLLEEPVVLGDYQLLSPEDMRSDLDTLFEELEAKHPNLYAVRSKADVDAERQQISDELAQPMTVIDFYKKVGLLIASLGDYHTFVSEPDDIQAFMLANELFLPFNARMETGHAYLVDNFSENTDIPFGTELLGINDIPISVIYEEAKSYDPYHRYISFLTFSYVLGSMQEYKLALLLPGETIPVTLMVPGEPLDELLTRPLAKQVMYITLPGEKIGLLTISYFSPTNDLLLKPRFKQIQKDGVEHLIIDIRDNPGGVGDTSLLNYLTDQPWSFCAYYMKLSETDGSAETAECLLEQPSDEPYRYHGKIYLLIGPDTNSAAVTYATILQDYHLAILIGEETLTPASHSSDFREAELPRTHLIYGYPALYLIRPSGVEDGRGVIPDIIIATTIADEIAGIDPVMEYTLELIRSGQMP